MKLSKCLKHAFSMVLHSKLRSWLTILGIVIGVAAVIAIMSLGQGLQTEIRSQLGNLGTDLLTITAGYSRGTRMGGGAFFGPTQGTTANVQPLGRKELQILRGIPDIHLINPTINGRVKATYLSKSGTLTLTGVDQKTWAHITTEKAAEGRLLNSADTNVIVIGGRLASSYFDRPVGLNKMLTIEGSAFRVVGILDDSSTNIYMPLQMAAQVLEDKEAEIYDSIIVKVKDEDALELAIEKIESRLMLARHVTASTKDFTVSSNSAMNETRAEMMGSMNMFLIAIASVSLIVGAVGVANTMFTSVLERRKQIGIMKAIGARNKDIMRIFLINAALIGFVGGLIGILLGILLSGALPAMLGNTGFLRGGTFVSLNSILLSLSVSVGVGVLAGIVPAYQASKLKPVDALRYE
jgi:putative ABC transport system permease protein